MRALTGIVRGFRALGHVCVTISVITSRVIVGWVFYWFLDRALNWDHRGDALFFFSACLGFFRGVVCLIRTKACLGREIGRANESSCLFRGGAFKLRRFMVNQDYASVGGLFNRFLRLFGFGEAVVRHYE